MKHPGQIAYYEIRDEKDVLLHTDSIENIPISMQFADTPNGKVPVVKAVMKL